jgi:hypothetical protein
LYLPQSQSVSIKNSNFNGKWPAYISAPTGSTNATLVISNSKFGGGRNVESAYMTENGAGGALTIVSFADVKIADSKFSDSASAHTGGMNNLREESACTTHFIFLINSIRT